MTSNVSDIFNQHLWKAIEDLKDRVAPGDMKDWFPGGPALVSPEAYAIISEDLDAALELQESGDIKNSLEKIMDAAQKIGYQEGLQDASFKASEPEILRQANARHGSMGGSRKGEKYEERRNSVVEQVLRKDTFSPWRSLNDLKDEVRRLADEAFEGIKYSDCQIDMILRHPEIRRICNSLKRAMRRSR